MNPSDKIMEMLRSPDVEMKNLGASMMKSEFRVDEQINILNRELNPPYKYQALPTEDGSLIFKIYIQPISTAVSSYGYSTSMVYVTKGFRTC